MKVTPDDITDAMVTDVFRSYELADTLDWIASHELKQIIAASVNAYFANNPACAAGEELFKALDLSNRMLGEVLSSFNPIIGERSKESIRKLIAINDVAIAKAKGGEA